MGSVAFSITFIASLIWILAGTGNFTAALFGAFLLGGFVGAMFFAVDSLAKGGLLGIVLALLGVSWLFGGDDGDC